MRHAKLSLLPYPFPRVGARRKAMRPQKPSDSPGHWPEVIERERVTIERAAQKVRNWTVQNERRGVLDRVSAGAA